jgi:hypothetical protein
MKLDTSELTNGGKVKVETENGEAVLEAKWAETAAERRIQGDGWKIVQRPKRESSRDAGWHSPKLEKSDGYVVEETVEVLNVEAV